MLAECADEQWGTTSNIVLYHLLHGFETEKGYPKRQIPSLPSVDVMDQLYYHPLLLPDI